MRLDVTGQDMTGRDDQLGFIPGNHQMVAGCWFGPGRTEPMDRTEDKSTVQNIKVQENTAEQNNRGEN